MLSKIENDDFRPTELPLRSIVIFIFISTILAIFMDNSANSLIFRSIDYEVTYKINFKPLLVIFNGIFLGPFWGGVSGFLIDAIPFRIWRYGDYDFSIMINILSILRGIISGYVYHYYFKKFKFKSVFISTLLSLLPITALAMPAVLYYSYGIDFWSNLQDRIIPAIITTIFFSLLIYFTLKHFEQKQSLKKVKDELEELLNIDVLTKVASRRAFMEYLNKMISYAQRNSKNLFILSLDLDDFKKINDNYGHAAGDKVLKALGETLNNELREEDMPGRLGGDEFAIILVDKEVEEVQMIGERLQKRIKEIEIEGIKEQITTSIGLTKLKMDDDRDQILDRADNALYIAKDEGKDFLVIN